MCGAGAGVPVRRLHGHLTPRTALVGEELDADHLILRGPRERQLRSVRVASFQRAQPSAVPFLLVEWQPGPPKTDPRQTLPGTGGHGCVTISVSTHMPRLRRPRQRDCRVQDGARSRRSRGRAVHDGQPGLVRVVARRLMTCEGPFDLVGDASGLWSWTPVPSTMVPTSTSGEGAHHACPPDDQGNGPDRPGRPAHRRAAGAGVLRCCDE
jgi:hypothetical protein